MNCAGVTAGGFEAADSVGTARRNVAVLLIGLLFLFGFFLFRFLGRGLEFAPKGALDRFALWCQGCRSGGLSLEWRTGSGTTSQDAEDVAPVEWTIVLVE